MSQRLIGVVLAGGRSRRMGRDKALLDWQGAPLIDHMIGLLRDAGIAEVVVSGDRPDYDGIADIHVGGGPIIGLLSVVETVDDDVGLLVLPIDMPQLTVAMLQALQHANKADDVDVVRYGEFALPMRLRVNQHTRAALREVASNQGRERSLLALQSRLHLHTLPVTDDFAAALVNCNTPEEWQKAVTP